MPDTDTLPPLPPQNCVAWRGEKLAPVWFADEMHAYAVAALAAQAAPAEADFAARRAWLTAPAEAQSDATLADQLAARAAPLDGVGNPALYHALRAAEAWLRGFAPMRIVTAQQAPSDDDIDGLALALGMDEPAPDDERLIRDTVRRWLASFGGQAAIALPEWETPEMHDAVMAVVYQGVRRTNTDALWQAYRSVLLAAAPKDAK